MSDKFDYPRYLASREWAQKKEAVRERSSGWCERCGVRNHDQTHHLTYKNIGKESIDELLGVCRECHEFLSAKSDYDPTKDVIVFAVAFNRKFYEGGQRWINALVDSGGRLVGSVNPADVQEVEAAMHGTPIPEWLKKE